MRGDMKKVVLEHNNFLESGVEGILTDLDKELDLPEELYLINKYQMTFDGDGTIQTIYTFLYGKDTEGKTKTYLIDYNAAKGNRMTVRTDGAAVTDYNPDMRLEPMLMILEKADYRQRLSDWENIFGDKIYGILYFGRRSFRSEEGLCYIPGDADQDGAESGTSDFTPLQRGGEVTGFALSLHIPSAEEVTPVRYMMEPEYKSQEELDREEAVRENEREAGQIEAFREMDGFQVDRTTGAMYFFLNESLGWRFIVTDAALGSRFYGMEQTGDGGTTWQIINKDPFNGDMGVTEGLVFLDENFGFAGLSGASETSSLMFVTRDGGKTFAKVLLPMDTVTELPESAGEYGFTIEDYDYIHMPEKDGDAFVICVSSEALEREGILFRSSDAGETWEYAGCRQYSDSSTS